MSEHLDGDMPDGHLSPRLLRVSRTEGRSPLAIAFSPCRGEVFTRVYGLNTQESALVCAIAAGASLGDIARASKRSLEAVRSQLKRIFRKTGTSRQTELVKLVLSGPAAMVQ